MPIMFKRCLKEGTQQRIQAQRHEISSESLNGFWTWSAGIALPRR